MSWQVFATVFAAVFIAELGDKTQIATMLFASDQQANRWLVFAAASAALVCTTALGVVAGAAIGGYVSERALKTVAGVGFIAIGVWTLWR